MAGKVRYLLERNGRYYSRLLVPVELRTVLGSELRTPLGGDRRSALRAHNAAVAKLQAKIEAARDEIDKPKVKRRGAQRAAPMTTPAMARSHYRDLLAEDESMRNHDPRWALGLPDMNYIGALREVIKGTVTDNVMALVLAEAASKFMDAGNTDVEPNNEGFREYARALAVAEVEARKVMALRDEGEPDQPPTHPLLQPEAPLTSDTLKARALTPEAMKTLEQILPEFLDEKKARPGTVREYIVIVRMFGEVIDANKPLYAITKPNVIEFKRILSRAPANYSKRFPGKTILEAIELNALRKQPFDTLDPYTLNNKHLSRLRTLLQWCVNNAILPDNPANGVKVDGSTNGSEPSRLPFTTQEINSIFTPLLDRKNQPYSEQVWALLIAVHTGMRASEIAQLKISSIREERDILCFAVEERTKNAGSRRLVPVHSNLIELGLEERIAVLKRARQTHLFPTWFEQGKDSATDANVRFTQYIPRWFSRTYLPSVGIVDKRKVFHSFRHHLKTALAVSGVDRLTSDAITGHADGSVAGRYIHGVSIERMRDAIELMQLGGMKISDFT